MEDKNNVNESTIKIKTPKKDETMEKMVNDVLNADLHSEKFKSLPEDEQKFILIRAGMLYNNCINTIERVIAEMEHMVRTLVPETIDVLKILLARLEDINPEKIDKLSAGFIENTFTIDGRKLRVTLPEVGDYDDTEFKRAVIRQIKVCDEQVAVAVEYLKQVKEKYQEDIPNNIKELLSNTVETDKWVTEFIKSRINNSDMSDKMREEFQKKLEYKEYGYTLKPIIDSIRNHLDRRTDGSASILKGFYINNEKVLEAAVNVCSNVNVTFPFQMMIDLDSKLFEEGKYDKKYRNLIVYLIARYIRYRAESIDEFDKVFLTTLFANMVMLNRPGAIEKYPDIADKMRKSIGTCMDLVVI
jgi:hypothetical protein